MMMKMMMMTIYFLKRFLHFFDCFESAFLGLGSVTVESGMFFWCDFQPTMLQTASRRPVLGNFEFSTNPGNLGNPGNPGDPGDPGDIGDPGDPGDPGFLRHFWASGASRLNPACFFGAICTRRCSKRPRGDPFQMIFDVLIDL